LKTIESKDKLYYLYTHNNATGEILYVGSGTLVRVNNTSHNSARGEKYKGYVKNNGKLIPHIVAEFKTKAEALNAEIELYKSISSTYLLNINEPSGIKQMPNIEILEEYLYYDEGSPSCLRWKVNSRNTKVRGVAGGIHKSDGYYRVQLLGKSYMVHRIVCILHGLEIPDNFVVDHIDGNRANNTISNLKVCSFAENCRNKRRSGRNSNLPVGVTLRNIKGVEYLIATATHPFAVTKKGHKKLLRKHFRINQFGYEVALRLATECRAKFLVDIEREFDIMYSENHK
jgi:predicted GIY-YIG superfamily endonuclease